jgi:hypothetical protein
MHTTKSLKNIKNSYCIFIQNKNYVLACILGFNNQFIKVIRTRPNFKNTKKHILFSFNN